MIVDLLWQNLFSQTDKNIREVLKNNPLFASLNAKELELLARMVHTRSFVAGEFVFLPGKGIGMYIILTGQVNILYGGSESQKPTVVSTIKEEDFFGEIALVQGQGYHQVSAQAVKECTLLGFLKPDLLTLIEKKPTLAAKILMNLGSVIGKRLQKAGDKLFQIDQKMDA